MTTFSQLVDKAVLETSRPDMRDQIADYLNQTIREIHFEPDSGKVVYYESNYREVQVTAAVESGQAWTIPDPTIFQKELCVRFDNRWSCDGPAYAEKAIPGPKMRTLPYFYYRAADSLVFGGTDGYGGIGAKISVAWFEYPRGLVYIPVAEAPNDRKAIWDAKNHTWFFSDDEMTPEQQATLLLKYTNWVLQRWEHVLLEGLRAKIYKRTGDESRQRTSYSLFKQGCMNLMSSESSDYGVMHT